MKKIVIIGAAVVVLGGMTYLAFGSSKEKENGLKLVEVTRDTIIEKALAVGQLEPKQEIQVKSKISGIVSKLHVDVGYNVKAGDPLLTVAPNPTPLEYSEAKRRLQLAQVDFNYAGKIFNRQKELFEKNLTSQQQFDISKAEFDNAELIMQLAQEKFDLLQKGVTSGGKNENTIIAPINGTILEKHVNEGDPVVPLTSYQAGTPLLSLAPLEDLIFKGTVDEIDVGKLTEGMTCEIKIGALPDKQLVGTLLKISPKARKQDNTTLFDLEIEVDKAEARTLRAGYSANADIIISKKDSVLVIPERLVTFVSDSDTVRVEVQDTVTSEIEFRDIEVGLSDGLNIEVISGLALGEKIVERPPKEIE